MALGIIFTALFASAFGIMYMFYTTRNRERMAMIENGANPELFKSLEHHWNRLNKLCEKSSSS